MKTMFRVVWICIFLLSIFGGSVYASPSIDFVDAENGWAITYVYEGVDDYIGMDILIHTSDGGQNWEVQKSEGGEFLEDEYYYLGYFVCMDFVSPTEGWIVLGTGDIIHTEDGGNTWETQGNIPELWNKDPIDIVHYDMCFVDPENGWVISATEDDMTSSVIFHTTDGGQSWTIQRDLQREGFIDIDFVSPDVGWTVGFKIVSKGLKVEPYAMIYNTTDGGETWLVQQEEEGGIFELGHFINASEGWVIGYDVLYYIPSILHTSDGGETWEYKSSLPVEEISSIFFTDSNNGWIVGGGIYHTSDGGETWIMQDVGFDLYYGEMFFVDSNEGWISGYNYSDGYVIAHTSDGGNTWELQWGEPKPLTKVTNVSVAEGDTIPGNSRIVVEFSDYMQSVEIEVSDTKGTTILDFDTAVWTPDTVISPGKHTLAITGVDWYDKEMEEFTPIEFTAGDIDTISPEIVSDACEPKNGATNVEIQGLENIKIVFSEGMLEVKLVKMEPIDARVIPEFDGDRILNLKLMKYVFPEGKLIKITVFGEDFAGNQLKSAIYSFTTKTYQTEAVDDYSHIFTMQLKSGLNMISLPLKPEVPYSARAFAEKLSALMVIKYNEDSHKFQTFIPEIPGDGFPIEGGKGYIVSVAKDTTVAFTGAAWDDENPAKGSPPSFQTDGAWAFVAYGPILDGDANFSETDIYTVRVRNLLTNEVIYETARKDRYFAAAFVDLNRKPVIKAGAEVEVAVFDKDNKLVSGPFVHKITQDQVRNAIIKTYPKLGDIIPANTMLLQNFPNPFNPDTWIPYQLKEDNEVTIRIFSMTGDLVQVIRPGYKNAGLYIGKAKAAYWDGKNKVGELVASGVYFYTIQAGDFTSARKMILAK